jgi:16S rRNA (uracil1498-N3)-methyltransferase
VVGDLDAGIVRLEGAEGRHLVRSLRAQPGDTIPATDGRGGRGLLEVRRVRGPAAELEVLEMWREEVPWRRWWLGTGLSGPRGDWLVEKAVELGAWGLVAWGGGPDARTVRWERLARAALGQSFGSWELRIRSSQGLEALLASCPGQSQPWQAVVVADPKGSPAGSRPASGFPEGDLLLLAGPPQGFGARDAAALRITPRITSLSLGPRRLRSETACLALLAWALLTDDRDLQTAEKGWRKG